MYLMTLLTSCLSFYHLSNVIMLLFGQRCFLAMFHTYDNEIFREAY